MIPLTRQPENLNLVFRLFLLNASDMRMYQTVCFEHSQKQASAK